MQQEDKNIVIHDIEEARQSLLNFPERFPIKIFGEDTPEFHDFVKKVIESHVEKKDCLDWQVNLSKKGRFAAVTVIIMAQNQLQLDAIYLDLTGSNLVKMAL